MISIVVHGGAWDIPDKMVYSHCDGVRKAFRKGWEILSKGASAVDAVVQLLQVSQVGRLAGRRCIQIRRKWTRRRRQPGCRPPRLP